MTGLRSPALVLSALGRRGIRVLVIRLVVLVTLSPSIIAQVSTRYVYDAAGQLVQAIHADGTLITYDYDAAGNLLRRVVTSPNGNGAIQAISPTAVEPASVTQVTVFGAGLEATTGVTFDTPSITATLDGAPEPNAIFLTVRVDATATAGPHTFTVERSGLSSIDSGSITLNVTPVPILLSIAPTQVFTGNTITQFTLSGARLDHSPTVVFDKPGFTLTDITTSADGTSLTGRLQVALTALPVPVGVSMTTSEGTTKKKTLSVGKSVSGLTGSYFADAFKLDSAGLPVIPTTSPSFIRSDAALQFGTSTGFRFRPCFFGGVGCLNAAYTVRWHGYILLASAGAYTFALNSSDASQLLIGGTPVVSNPGSHAATTAQGVFTTQTPGSYPVTVLFNTSGATPGIDLLYQPPGAAALSPVPASVLWGDGSVYDPVLSSAAAAVSWSNPAMPTPPGSQSLISGAASAVSFMNPAATPQPGALASTGNTAAAVSFANPSPAIAPGVTAPVGSTSATVSFSNPTPTVAPGGTASLSAAVEAVAFAAGPVVYQVAPVQLARSAGGGVLTIIGRNLAGATTVLLEGGSSLAASTPSASADGTTVTTTVSLTTATPTGFVNVRVTTPSGTSPASGVLLEIVP